MKVLCINDKTCRNMKHPYLTYGDIYEPIGEVMDIEGDECYVMPWVSNTICASGLINNGPFYLKSRFIPLSDIDETEFVRNYKTETV